MFVKIKKGDSIAYVEKDNFYELSRDAQGRHKLRNLEKLTRKRRRLMNTVHNVIFSSSAKMDTIAYSSIELMITSPPYPMIEMWDEIFSKQNPAIGEALREENGNKAFELMNKELDKVWKEVFRVLIDGGFACINIGNATRKIGDEFKLYSNHSRILEYCIKFRLQFFT